MSRIDPVVPSTASPSQSQALRLLREAWGGVPNLGGVVAHSHAMTSAMLAFENALEGGAFAGGVAEQLAIAVANENSCLYCLAAHTAAARAQGVSREDAAAARDGEASGPRVSAALLFTQSVVRKRGFVTDAELDAVRNAGYSDGEVVELVGHAIANTFTNYLHHVAEVPVEFPIVALSERKLVEAA